MSQDQGAIRADPVTGAARVALRRLCAAGFVAYCSYAICRTPLLPLFARELGAGPALIGFVMGASTLTGIVVKLPAGALSDVFGRRRLLIAGALVFASLPFTYLAASTLFVLILLRFVHGAATAIFGPVASASLSDLAPPATRGTWLSTYSTAQGTGQALGPVLAGYLIATGRFDLAFLASGVIGIAVPFIVAGWPDVSPAGPARAPWQELRRGVAEVGRDRLVIVTSGAQAAQFALNGMLNAFLPLYGRDVLGLTTSELGWMFGLQTVTTLAVRPVIGFVSDRAGRRWVIVTGLATCGAAMLLISMANLAATVTAILVYAAGVATTTAATSAYITDITRRARYGAAHGVFGTIYDIGDALGPITAGLLVASLGYAWMFQVMAAVALAMALVFAIASRPTAAEQKRGTLMKMVMLFMALVALGATIVAQGASRKVDFSDDAVGQPPKGFEFGHTTKAGAPGKWIVEAEGANKHLAQVDADDTRARFPVAVVGDISAADIDLSVRFRPISGRVDQAAGLVWRYRDQDNYYIVRANALEDNVVLYKVENGKRTDLPVKGEGRTYGKTAEVPAGQWSTLRVVAHGRLFEVYFNGTKLYGVEDATFTEPGKVGVWTKADSVTQFDDLTIVTK